MLGCPGNGMNGSARVCRSSAGATVVAVVFDTELSAASHSSSDIDALASGVVFDWVGGPCGVGTVASSCFSSLMALSSSPCSTLFDAHTDVVLPSRVEVEFDTTDVDGLLTGAVAARCAVRVCDGPGNGWYPVLRAHSRRDLAPWRFPSSTSCSSCYISHW